MRTQHVTSLLLGCSLIALSACTAPGWFQEAGAEVSSNELGVSTLSNTRVQTGQEGFVLDLAQRFAEQVPTTVNFEFNSAVLDEAARQTLRQQANWIRQFPEIRFRVYGHTDLVGTNAYNRRLGQRRANAVVHYLGSLGISRSRLEAVVSFGETQPVIATPNPERRNRRTVTEVTGFVKSHPLILDGKYAEVVYREYVESATSRTTLENASSSDTE